MSIEKTPILSVVMPAYNEETNIDQAVEVVRSGVLDRVSDAELIVVDDGSRDQTFAKLKKWAGTDGRIHVVHQENKGHGPALMRGLREARGNYFFLIDSDLQIPMDHFLELWAAAKQVDAAFGIRTHRKDPIVRLIITRALRASLRYGFRADLRDANSPFKIITRDLWEKASRSIPADSLIPSLLLAIFARKNGYRIREIAVAHRERPSGVSTLRHLKLIKFCWLALQQIRHFNQTLAQ